MREGFVASGWKDTVLVTPGEFRNFIRLAVPRNAGFFREVGRRFLDRHVVQGRPVLEVRPAPTCHHRAGQNTVNLNTIGDAAIGECLRQGDDRSIYRADGRIGRLQKQGRIAGHQYYGALGFRAGQAATVSRRAPCSFSAKPCSHYASVISSRSICGTALEQGVNPAEGGQGLIDHRPCGLRLSQIDIDD